MFEEEEEDEEEIPVETDTYSIRISCDNCNADSYIYAKKGTWAKEAIAGTRMLCRNCGCCSWSKHIFQ